MVVVMRILWPRRATGGHRRGNVVSGGGYLEAEEPPRWRVCPARTWAAAHRWKAAGLTDRPLKSISEW